MENSISKSHSDADLKAMVQERLIEAMNQHRAREISSADLKAVNSWAARMNETMGRKRLPGRATHRPSDDTAVSSDPGDSHKFWAEVLALVRDGKIKPRLFSIRFVWIKPEDRFIPANAIGNPDTARDFRTMLRSPAFRLKVLSPMELPTYPNALKVMFVDYKSVFREYRRQFVRRAECGIESLANLRRSCAMQSWFLPGPDGSHRQRLGEHSTTTRCWCIALDTFPMAQEFRDKLEDIVCAE